MRLRGPLRRALGPPRLLLLPLLLLLLTACAACPVANPARVPVVEVPPCPAPVPAGEAGGAPAAPTPGVVENDVPLAWLAACDGNSTVSFTSNEIISARRADDTIDTSDVMMEHRYVAFPFDPPGDDPPVCEVHIDTLAYEMKLEERQDIGPFPAVVTLCAARVTTSRPEQLTAAGVSVTLQRLQVGYEHQDSAPVLATMVGDPSTVPIESVASPALCDATDQVTAVDEYGFRHRAIIHVPMDDLYRLAWDGVFEMAFDVKL